MILSVETAEGVLIRYVRVGDACDRARPPLSCSTTYLANFSKLSSTANPTLDQDPHGAPMSRVPDLGKIIEYIE